MDEPDDDRDLGDGILNLCFSGTGAIVGTSIAGAALPDAFRYVHAILAGLLFAVGTGALLWGYALGVARSRAVVVTLSGLFFLGDGAAPPTTRRQFRLALVIQTVATVAAALVRPDTEVAFGVLAPVFGLGLMAMWGGRHGAFPARPDQGRGRSRPEP